MIRLDSLQYVIKGYDRVYKSSLDCIWGEEAADRLLEDVTEISFKNHTKTNIFDNCSYQRPNLNKQYFFCS